MGNPRSFTTKYVAVKETLQAFTKPLRSTKARREAIERAATMPNSQPMLPRAKLIDETKKAAH